MLLLFRPCGAAPGVGVAVAAAVAAAAAAAAAVVPGVGAASEVSKATRSRRLREQSNNTAMLVPNTNTRAQGGVGR